MIGPRRAALAHSGRRKSPHIARSHRADVGRAGIRHLGRASSAPRIVGPTGCGAMACAREIRSSPLCRSRSRRPTCGLPAPRWARWKCRSIRRFAATGCAMPSPSPRRRVVVALASLRRASACRVSKGPDVEVLLIYDAPLDFTAPARPVTDRHRFPRAECDVPAEEPRRPAPQDTACVLYTSGTTGASKAVLVPWRQLALVLCRRPSISNSRSGRSSIFPMPPTISPDAARSIVAPSPAAARSCAKAFRPPHSGPTCGAMAAPGRSSMPRRPAF